MRNIKFESYDDILKNIKDVVNDLAIENGENQDIFILDKMADLQKELIKRKRGIDNRDKIVDEGLDTIFAILILLSYYGIKISDIINHFDYTLGELKYFIK